MATFVFVHGAWLGSWIWKKILGPLRKKGHDVYAVTLTGMGDRVHLAREDFGMDTATQDVVNLLEYEDLHDVVLVGHSFAGKVISRVYDEVPERIKMLFYFDAFVPQKSREPQGGIEQMSKDERGIIEKAVKAEGSGWKLGVPDEFLDDLAWDLKGDDKDWFFSKLTPWPSKLAFESIQVSEKVDKAKKAYIFCNRSWEDIEKQWKDFLDSLDGEYKLLVAAHYPMVTKVDETIDALIALSKS